MAFLLCSLRGNRQPLVGLFAALAIQLALLQAAVRAEDFRVETKVFIGEKAAPVSETTTLFLDGNVYDFLHSPAQTAVLRKPKGKNPGRFTLLNDERRISTEISLNQLQQAIDRVQTWAGRQADPFLKFAANPDFKETFDQKKGELVLASHWESYKVSTEPTNEHVRAAAEYREFLDRFAQLNTLLAGGPPPQPRLKLNDAFARHKVMPATVELTRAGEKQPLRAEHKFVWRLSQEDRKRIDEVHAALTSYRSVDNEEFVQSTETLEPGK